MVLNKGINLIDSLKMHSYYILYLLGYTLPFAFLFGLLLSVGRLIADNEMVAIHVAGISILKILNIFLILGIIFSLFLFVLSNRIIPDSHYRYRSNKKAMLFKNINTLVEPRMFLDFQNYILYVSDKKGSKLKNVFIYEVDERKKTNKVIFAKKGEFVTEGNTLKIKLEDGFRDETSSKKKEEFYRLNFKIFFMDLPIKEQKTGKIGKKESDMRLKELKSEISRLREMGIKPTRLAGEFHKRISYPFSIIAFVFLGFGISLKVKHRERSVNFGIAFLAGLGGYLLFLLGQTLVETGVMPPLIGMWLPNLITTSVGCCLLYKNVHFR